MKTLILNGSPRKNGDTVSLIKKLTQQLNGEYKIEPKKIDGKNISCAFCKYKDLCYMSYEDELDLPKKPFKEEE